jgi:hypothetical protein
MCKRKHFNGLTKGKDIQGPGKNLLPSLLPGKPGKPYLCGGAGRPAPAKLPQGGNAARVCGRSGVFGAFLFVYALICLFVYEPALGFVIEQARI